MNHRQIAQGVYQKRFYNNSTNVRCTPEKISRMSAVKYSLAVNYAINQQRSCGNCGHWNDDCMRMNNDFIEDDYCSKFIPKKEQK